MGNVRVLHYDWHTGKLVFSSAGVYLARQYDHLSNLVVLINAPRLQNYYLIVTMKEAEDGEVTTLEPIELTGSYWLIPNIYTQLSQEISFQFCCKTESGDFESHSAEIRGCILPSKEHDGAAIDVDPSIMFDPYKRWVESLAMAAGAIVIESEINDYSTNPVQNRTIKAAIDEINSDIAGVSSNIGDLSLLETDEKEDVVHAINSMYTNHDLKARVDKVVLKQDEYTVDGNIVDISNATRTSAGVIRGLRMDHPFDGTFYINPFAYMVGGFINWYPYNAQNEAIPILKNGSSAASYIQANNDKYYKTWEVSGTTITVKYDANKDHFDTGNIKSTDVYTLSEVPAYWIGEGKGPDYFRGFTVEPQDDYVEYTAPEHITNYLFTEDLREFVIDNSGGGGSGDTSGLLATTYNLLDESKLDWDSAGTYLNLKTGYYIPVTSNETYVCNQYKTIYRFYDSSYTEVGRKSAVNKFAGVTAPAEAVWLRVTWNRSNSGLTQIKPIMVYKTDAAESSRDDIKNYISHFEIQPKLINGDIFTHAAPDSLNAEILNMARQVAVRAFNKTRNAIRVGTFNIYLPRGRDHWELLKKECQDVSLDILAMQEISNISEKRVQRYLSNNNWQFLYGSRSEFDGVYPQQGVVSAYEIVSTELYTMSTNRTYVKCVINLPKYKKHPHQFTLSIYSFHGNLTASNRVTEVNEMLATIANDTSDFIIVCGDTNAFVSEADAMGKRPSWEAWITGGFTPIHYGEFSTIASIDNVETGIDQIFMGHNVSCANWDIVPSYDYTLIDSNGDEIPISDHCMIYADLVFDYEAVLASL